MTSPSRLPDAFQASYLKRDSYPQNLGINGPARDSRAEYNYFKNLKGASTSLFEKTKLDVRFRDLMKNDGNGEG